MADVSGRELTLQEKLARVRKSLEWNLKFLCKEYLNTPHWSKVHDELQVFLLNAGKRIHIELPRGHLKSWIVTQGWAIQQMLSNPDIRILIVNATESNATKMLRYIRSQLSRGSILSQYYGGFETDVWSQEELLIRQRKVQTVAPTFLAAGLQKTLTSQHFDLIIADDLVEPDNVRTKDQRDKVYEFYLSLFDLLEPNGRMVVIGTRYHQDDLYSKILEENATYRNWSVFVRSCYHPDGSVLFPEKFSHAQLEDIKKKSFYHFSTQYLNNPIDPENADFKASQVKYYDPTTPHPGSLYLTIDPAIALSRDADFTAMVVAGMFSDRRIRVVDCLHKRLIPSELVDAVFDLVKKWRLHRVGIETFAFQKTLKYDIQRKQRETGLFFSVDELGKRHSGHGEAILSKEARIRRLQPYFEQGLVEIRSDMSELRDELLSFPRGKHDDLCLTGDTLISTKRGDVPIREVHSRDFVLTPLGWRSVLYSDRTGVSEVVPFFGTGATKGHKVFAYGKGFSPFDTLTYQDDLSKLSLCELYRWAYRERLFSMASGSDLWGRKDITLASQIPIRGGSILKDFMWRCGNFILERRFPQTMKFIIGITTRLIMTTQIWSAYRLHSIVRCQKEMALRGCERIWKGSDLLRRLGIGLKRVVDGIANTQWISGPILDFDELIASNAGVRLKPRWGTRNSVVERALQNFGDFLGRITSNEFVFNAERNLGQTSTEKSEPAPSPADPASSGPVDVYNLQVEDGCYFANGILVSNCDALSYQLDYLVPSIGTQKAKEEMIHGSMAWWLQKLPERKQSLYDKFIQSGMK